MPVRKLIQQTLITAVAGFLSSCRGFLRGFLVFPLCCCFCLSGPAFAMAQQPEPAQSAQLSLAGCIRLAGKNHPDVAVARAGLSEAEAMVARAESENMPTLSYMAAAHFWNDDLKLDDVPFADGVSRDFVFEGRNQGLAALSFSWPVYNWGRVTQSAEAAGYELKARQFELVRTRELAISTAITAYWSLASALEAQKYLAVTLNELRLFLDTATADMENGAQNAPEKDIIQIKIDIHTMEAWREVLHRWEKSAAQTLSIATGIPLQRIDIANSEVIYRPLRISYDQCLAAAFQHRADLQAVARRIHKAALMVEVAEKVNYPDLALVGKARVLEDDYSPSPPFNGMLGVEIHGVLYDGARNDAAIQEARAKLAVLKMRRLQRREEVRQQVRDTYLKVKESYNSVIQYSYARQQTMKKLTVVREGYPLLLSTVKDVQETQLERRFRDKDYIFAKLALIKSLTALNLVTGSTVYNFISPQKTLVNIEEKNPAPEQIAH